MSKALIKKICLFTLILFNIYTFFPMMPLIYIEKVEAASLEEKDVYKGMALALLLILVSKIGQANDIDHDVIYTPDIKYERPDYNDKDLYYLAKVIHGEARGEPFEGQIAVGAVVLNRKRSPQFPNTIKEVIYQENQFSCVDDGQINLVPNQTAYKAAREALNGNDPSKGALYFYNPDTAKTLWWLSSRKTTIKIGNHVFAR